MTKLISWNVNGLRACVQKGFLDYFKEADADFFCIQESKLQEGQIDLDLPGYRQFWNYAEKKGYSGTAIFAKEEPLSAAYGIGVEEHDHEGRVITLEYPDYYVVTCYTPNSKDGLLRLDYRMTWEDAFLAYLKSLEAKKPVIFCGDLNVAHEEIDLKNPKTNHRNAGFTDEERGKFTALLNAGFIDTYRYFHPDKVEYSWWSYRFKAREKNVGWRIDYFCVSEALRERLASASIHTEVYGSDHCPVELCVKSHKPFYALDRIERVEKYERLYDEARATHDPETLRLLEAYYTSGEWRKDYEADERGELPPDLKRGVLSQDALYDLLE